MFGAGDLFSGPAAVSQPRQGFTLCKTLQRVTGSDWPTYSQPGSSRSEREARLGGTAGSAVIMMVTRLHSAGPISREHFLTKRHVNSLSSIAKKTTAENKTKQPFLSCL